MKKTKTLALQIEKDCLTMAHNCSNCAFRAKYDKKPKSILGRVWRWHAGWCPGWNKYMKSLPDQERREIAIKYDMDKFKKPSN